MTIKAQGLLGHLGNTGNFLLRQVGVAGRLPIERRLVPQQVEKIGDRLQGIVDFVSNGSRQTPGRRQLFRLPQCFFSPLAFRRFNDDRSHPADSLGRRLDRVHIDEPIPHLRIVTRQGGIQLELD